MGVPEKVLNSEGTEIDMGLTIRDVLEDGSELTIVPSIRPDVVR